MTTNMAARSVNNYMYFDLAKYTYATETGDEFFREASFSIFLYGDSCLSPFTCNSLSVEAT